MVSMGVGGYEKVYGGHLLTLQVLLNTRTAALVSRVDKHGLIRRRDKNAVCLSHIQVVNLHLSL